MAARQAEADAKAEADAAAAAAAAAAANAGKKKGRRNRRTEEGEEEGGGKAAEVAVQRVVIRDEDVSTDEETEEERELPVYFKEPQQLLDIFTALEESNLFLIQNSQETEEALEELKVKFSETKTRMDAETVGLKAQIDTLRSSIRLEEDKGKALTERSGRNTGAHEQESTLSRLNSTVVEVYRAIFSEVDNSLSTLMMLTNIEAKLEELLTIIETMPREEVRPMPALLPLSLLPAPSSLLPPPSALRPPPSSTSPPRFPCTHRSTPPACVPPQVVVAEREKEKERRKVARELKTAQSIAAQEERIQRSIRRSQEPVVKRTGKPVMFRSQPIVRKKKVVDEGDKINPEDDVRRAALRPTRTRGRVLGCPYPTHACPLLLQLTRPASCADQLLHDD